MQQGNRECALEGPSTNFGHPGVFWAGNFQLQYRFWPLGGCFGPEKFDFSSDFGPQGVFWAGKFRLQYKFWPLGGAFESLQNLKPNLKSPHLFLLVFGMVLRTCPGPSVMGSQKYFKSRKCQGWVSSWGYAVYLDLEVGAKVKKGGKVKWSKGRFLQYNKAAVSVEQKALVQILANRGCFFLKFSPQRVFFFEILTSGVRFFLKFCQF